jgi:hypothetical protein
VKYPFAALVVCLAAAAQNRPSIGVIDTYGAHSISAEKLIKTLSVREGDPLPGSKLTLEEQLVAIKGVTRANVESVCCEAGKAIFYIGIEEAGRPHLDLREFPTNETLTLPEEVQAIYDRLIAATAEATREKQTAEDWRLGYSLMVYPAAQTVQIELPIVVERHLSILRQILRESANPDDRTVAATVLGYGPKTQGLIDDLQYALRDPEQTVRGAALRSLAPLTAFATANPQSGLRILTTWFVEMLNSVAWQDRMNTMNLLMTLTEKRDPYLMRHLRERGSAALMEMALWKHLPHALPAYILLGRTAAMTDAEIEETWSKNEREEIIKKLRKKLKG